ncbi:type II toxin-antitoxin system death-on-curing family toxin [Methylobacillus arboreus]|uniref:type II toxin-antitoxin system death-on-curing family toxin n=1 Tax=Methylobacillus arboreus TaxID=755170 RepID=UPI001E52C8EC|nr:type II toxin-antitoxin system death-on-curing family toxin [Methylobacillus arboreus]MCB5190756.1 type II toxin-antitoxin system death-on-curing family toxin [Methylobacillus arboreus]
MSWRWLDKQLLLVLHDESLAEHGGDSGMRDEGLLDSALARPINLANYESPDYADLAAAYCYGIAKNHPFIDGNKRAALLAAGLFLLLNGRKLTASQADATLTIENMAAGGISELELADWLRRNNQPKK